MTALLECIASDDCMTECILANLIILLQWNSSYLDFTYLDTSVTVFV